MRRQGLTTAISAKGELDVKRWDAETQDRYCMFTLEFRPGRHRRDYEHLRLHSIKDMEWSSFGAQMLAGFEPVKQEMMNRRPSYAFATAVGTGMDGPMPQLMCAPEFQTRPVGTSLLKFYRTMGRTIEEAEKDLYEALTKDMV